MIKDPRHPSSFLGFFQYGASFAFFAGICLLLAATISAETYRNQELEAYPELESCLVGEFEIPGLAAGFVPQGGYAHGEQHFFISGYKGLKYSKKVLGLWHTVVDEKRSAVAVINREDPAETSRMIELVEPSGKPMKRHAGGVAVWEDALWIPSKDKVFRFELYDFLSANVKAAKAIKTHKVDSKGSFVSVFSDYLLIGEFSLKRADTAPHHQSPEGKHRAWTAFYEYLSEEDSSELSLRGVIHHRRKVQCIAINEEGWVVLSVSYGKSDSKLAFYKPREDLRGPQTWSQEVKLPDGASIPSLTLSSENHKFTLRAPPGSQGVQWLGDQTLSVVFEGGAYPYRERWEVIEDRVLLFDFRSQLAKRR